MRNVLAVCVVAVLLFFSLSACGSSGGVSEQEVEAKQRGIIEGENLREAQSRSRHVEELLIGRVAGVRVEELAGGGIRVTIRGPGSIYGDNSPLYVVDGMPVRSHHGGLRGINPRDVESIRVLKDPADTTLYGVAGMNGVVLIQTVGASGKQGLRPIRD